MRSTLCILFLLGLGVTVYAATPENTLAIWTREFQRALIAGKPSPVVVTATLQIPRGQRMLVFQLTNVSKQALHVYPSELPWSRTNPLRVAAITTDGQQLPNEYPISDPPLSEDVQTLVSGQTLRGELPLSQTRLMTDKLPKDQDTVVLWLYSFTDTTQSHYLPCTGVIVVSRSR